MIPIVSNTCDNCNAIVTKHIFCNTKCKSKFHNDRRNHEMEILVVPKILKIQKQFEPLMACNKHHGSFTCGCKK